MQQKDIAGLRVSSITKQELLTTLSDRLSSDQKTFIITPYSEFLFHALADRSVLETFNKADFSVPDGIGLFWASTFLEIPFTVQSHTAKALQAFWQVFYTGLSILCYPKKIRSAFAEKIPGSDLIWDLGALAEKNNLSVYFLGGFGDTPKLVAEKMSAVFKGQLSIAGFSDKNPGDLSVIEDIQKAKPDILFVAYGPITQEQWIVEHKEDLPAKLFIGLGGTFDYIAGKRLSPPKWVRSIGLEWLYRLITQPYRIKRIFNAVFGLVLYVVRYKVFMSDPYRPNVVCAILNKDNNILICKRSSRENTLRDFGFPVGFFDDYWQLPQGGMDNNESFEQTAMREAREEVGLEHLTLIKISEQTSSYIWNNSQRKLFQGMQFKGQQQRIVYLRFLGNDAEVVVDQYEFVDYCWVPLKKLAVSVHEHRQPLVKIILEELSDLL